MENKLPENLYLGIELGSTRIKCSLIDDNGNNLENGIFNWENSFIYGNWTYDLNQAIYGVGQCYLDLKKKIKLKYGATLNSLKAIGISAMMHGLIAEDENNRLLTPFRTWRNTYTEQAALELSHELNFNIPARWTVAHIYYAIKNKEPFVDHIRKVSTLASYVHEKLTNRYCIGKDDASGIFPLENGKTYNKKFLSKVNRLFSNEGYDIKLENILPPIIECGVNAGALSPKGALLLDPDGNLGPGIPFVAPEGDYKTACLSAVLMKLSEKRVGATGFIEDYTYDLTKDNEVELGSHMLEVSPSFAKEKPLIEVHPLGIGGKEDPARLVFNGITGKGIQVTMVDLGTHFKLIAMEIELINSKPMPKLPVARIMWKIMPSFKKGLNSGFKMVVDIMQ